MKITAAVWAEDAPQARGMVADDFNVSATSVSRVISTGGTTNITDRDRIIKRYSGSVVEDNAIVTVATGTEAIVETQTPAVCLPPVGGGDGSAAWVSNGRCVLSARDPKGDTWGRLNMEFDIIRKGGEVVDNVAFNQSAMTTSLRQHMITGLLSKIAGKEPGAETCDLYSSASYVDPRSCVLNPNLVIDASLFSFCTFQNGGAQMAYMIGPRHAVYAKHTASGYSSIVVRRKNGTFVTANRLKSWSMLNDFEIGFYDTDITGIDYVELLPPSFEDKVGMNTDGMSNSGVKPVLNLPAFSFHWNPGRTSDGTYMPIHTGYRHFRVLTFSKAYDVDHYYVWPIPGTNIQQKTCGWHSTDADEDAQAFKFAATAYGGDSSSACYFWINNKPVLFSTYYGAGMGPWIPQMYPYLTDVMNELARQAGVTSPNYAPIWADLSMFPDLPKDGV